MIYHTKEQLDEIILLVNEILSLEVSVEIPVEIEKKLCKLSSLLGTIAIAKSSASFYAQQWVGLKNKLTIEERQQMAIDEHRQEIFNFLYQATVQTSTILMSLLKSLKEEKWMNNNN